MLLDEVDKMSSDLRGDPAHAPWKCSTLSKTKASKTTTLRSTSTSHTSSSFTNSLQGSRSAARPVEILEVTGYADDEKVEIAQRYLIPKQRELTG